jgi:filamentous hemagglutinin family protein
MRLRNFKAIVVNQVFAITWFAQTVLVVPLAQGQVIPDTSLGSEASLVTSQGTQDQITGGVVRGSNLFHSFQDFGVAEGRSVLFVNPADVTHIFSRVTGSQRSDILGTIGVLGNADLFLLNPNGILFGPEARLAVSGSFLATTGDRLTFADGTTFSARIPENNVLLTISTPTGLQLGSSPGAIVNQSRADGLGLTILPQQTLSLIGGDITLDGGRVTTQSGKIDLLSLRDSLVGLGPSASGFGMTFPIADLPTLGSILGRGGSIRLLNQAQITSQTTIANPEAQIHLVGGLVQLQGQSEVRTLNSSDAIGANIEIEAQDLQISNGGRLITVASGVGPGAGQGGEIRGTIVDQITIDGINPIVPQNISGFYSQSLNDATGGNLSLYTNRLLLTNGGQLLSDASSHGAGGSINVTAEQAIDGHGVSFLFPGVGGVIFTRSFASGRGGDLTINTKNLSLDGGAAIQTATFFDGPAGNLTLQIADTVSISGVNPYIPSFPSAIITTVYGEARGGDLKLTTTHLLIEDGANILTVVLPRDSILPLVGLPNLVGLPKAGMGDAGDVQVQAETITIRGVNAQAPDNPSQLSSLTFVEGNAGKVTVSTQELQLEAGGLMTSSSVLAIAAFQPSSPSLVRGNGADLNVKADAIVVDGINSITGLSSILGTQTAGVGSSGTTIIDTGSLLISNGGRVSASTIAFGNAGNLVVNARDWIEVTGVNPQGQISTLGTNATPVSSTVQQSLFLPPIPTGNSGTLQITTPRLEIRDGGTVGVQHFGTGNAGQIQVTANQLILDGGSKLTAATLSGNGGNIDLRIRDVVVLRHGSQITAEAGGLGSGGNLRIEAGAIVAVPGENSDIIANALGGQGGTITLRTGGLFGIQYRDRLTPDNDITASSSLGLNGTVEIDQLTFDPSRGLTAIPTAFLDESQQVGTTCSHRTSDHLALTGRGGLPPNPREQISARETLQDWRDLPIAGSDRPLQSVSVQTRSPIALPKTAPTTPIEAQSWQRSSTGKIELIITSKQPLSMVSASCATVLSPHL